MKIDRLGQLHRTKREKEIDRLKREEDDKLLALLAQRSDIVRRAHSQLARKLRGLGKWDKVGAKPKAKTGDAYHDCGTPGCNCAEG